MTNITFLDNEKELSEYTGLSHDELWKNGFDLDDVDCWLVVDEKDLPIVKIENFRCGDEIYYKWIPDSGVDEDGDYCGVWGLYCANKIGQGLYSILNDWENYCVGSKYVPYNGKVYVGKYHA